MKIIESNYTLLHLNHLRFPKAFKNNFLNQKNKHKKGHQKALFIYSLPRKTTI